MEAGLRPGEGVAAEMELKEILVESVRLVKNLGSRLVPFLLAFYVPTVVIYCLYAYINHEEVAKIIRLMISSTQKQMRPGGPANDPPMPESMSTTQILIRMSGLTINIACNYLAMTSTILLIFAHQEKDVKNQFSVKGIFTVLPDRFWRLAVTDMLKSFLLVGIFFLALLLFAALAMMARVIDPEVAGGLLMLEAFLSYVGFIYFLLNITLTNQIAAIERVWGMAAIKSSASLLKGKKMTVMTVLIFQVVASYVVYIVQTTLMLGPTWTKPLGFVIDTVMVTFILLFFTTVNTVLYLSCKAAQSEGGLDLPSFVKKPQAQYQPLQSP